MKNCLSRKYSLVNWWSDKTGFYGLFIRKYLEGYSRTETENWHSWPYVTRPCGKGKTNVDFGCRVCERDS